MKTLKHGKFKGQLWRGTCRLCDAEFEANYEEIKDKVEIPVPTTALGRPSKAPDPYAWVHCIECNSKAAVFFNFHSATPKEQPSYITIPHEYLDSVLSLSPEERKEIFQKACKKVPWKNTSTTPPIPPKAPPTRILSDAPLRSGPSMWQRFKAMLRFYGIIH